MSNISKWILLLALFVGLGSFFASCSTPSAPELTEDAPLRMTLSVLETTAAGLETPAASTRDGSSVPETGGPTPARTDASPTSLPGEAPTIETTPLPAPTITEGPVPLGPEPSPTLSCERDDSRMVLTASKTNIKVGETIDVKVVLKNTGCVSLGLPQYRLAILNSEGKPIFSPDKPEPVMHSLAVTPGSADEAAFTLQAVSPGKATLRAMSSFEVHLGYPGPAYWGANSSDELVIIVEE